jgi:hypothetical protein
MLMVLATSVLVTSVYASSPDGGASSLNLITVGAHPIAFSTGNTPRVIIDSSGRVGIGTSSPDLPLAVVGSIGSTGNLLLRGQSTGDQVIRVGSGRTDNGNSYIDLVGDTTYTFYGLRLIRSNTGANAASSIYHRGTGLLNIVAQDAASIVLGTASAERMRITSTGSVGIGTSSPAVLLDVLGDSLIQRLRSTTSTAAYLRFDGTGTSFPYVGLLGGIGTFGNTDASPIRFMTNSAERMRIDSSGNVLVGTTTADAAVTVYKSADSLDGVSIRQNSAGSSAGARLKFGNNSDTRDAEIVLTGSGNSSYAGARTLNFVSNIGGFGFYRSYTTPVATMVLDSSGNVGIGTTSPTAKVQVDGGIGSTSGQVVTSTALPAITMYYDTSNDYGVTSSLHNGTAWKPYVIRSAGMIFKTSFDVEAMRINSSGNVGIGTSSPATALHVNGTTQLGGASQVLATYQDGSGISIEAFDPSNTGTKKNIWINSYGGNVGIGTTSPSEKLTVSGNIALVGGGNMFSSATSSTYSIAGGNAFNNGGSITFGGSTSGVIAGGLIFNSGTGATNSEAMRINSSGNVLIGTTTIPGGQKMVVLGGGVQFSGGTSAQEGLRFQRDSGFVRISGINNDNNAFNAISFFTSGTAALHITTGNNVGIGTSSPAQALDVVTASSNAYIRVARNALAAGQAGLQINGGTGGVDWYLFQNTGSNDLTVFGNGSERMRIDSSGNVGIGTASPVKKLHVNGPALATIGTLTDGATITPNFDANQNFSVTLAGNRTLANPTNIDAGQTGSIFITQDGTGSRTLSFGATGTLPVVQRLHYLSSRCC